MAQLPMIKWAIATISLGKHQSHTLERKLVAAAKHGFQGIELVHSDLLSHAEVNGLSPQESARNIRELCKSLGLEILSLNPLKNFEGNVELSLQRRLENARLWIELAIAAGSSIVQVPSQFLANSVGDDEVIIPELQALADLAAEYNIKIAYEAVAFAKYNYLWQHSLRVVEAVNRSNFGLCLDSYHIHSRIWADPYTTSGKRLTGDRDLEASMTEFLASCPKHSIFYIQLSDASKFDPPLTDDSFLFDGLELKDARLAWSRSARPFPLEHPGYFPLNEIAKTWLVDFGWNGWVSIEGFLRETEQEVNGPEVMASRAMKSIEQLLSNLTLNIESLS